MGAFEDAFSPRNESAQPAQESPETQEPKEPASEAPATAQDERPAEAPATAREPAAQAQDNVPLAALQEERKKRQEAERRVAELEAFRQAALQAQAPAPKKAEPEEDEETRFYRDPIAYQKSLIKAAVEDIEKKNFAIRVEQSKRRLKSEVQDFDSAEAEFMQAAQHDANLRDQVLSHPDPARFAYEVGKMIAETKGIGSIVEYRKKVEAEVEARVRAELAKAQQPQNHEDEAPPSPGTQRGVGTTTKPQPTRDEFFSSVFQLPARRRAG